MGVRKHGKNGPKLGRASGSSTPRCVALRCVALAMVDAGAASGEYDHTRRIPGHWPRAFRRRSGYDRGWASPCYWEKMLRLLNRN